MNRYARALSFLAALLALPAQAQTLTTLVDGQPALAADVNGNFEALKAEIQALEAAVNNDRTTSSRKQKSWWNQSDRAEIDCTNNADALNDAIAAGQSDIFVLAGTCDARGLANTQATSVTGALGTDNSKLATLSTYGEVLTLSRLKTNYLMLNDLIFDGSINNGAPWVRFENIVITGNTSNWNVGWRAGFFQNGDATAAFISSTIQSPAESNCGDPCFAIWSLGKIWLDWSSVLAKDEKAVALFALGGSRVVARLSRFSNDISSGFSSLLFQGATGYFQGSAIQKPVAFQYGSSVQIGPLGTVKSELLDNEIDSSVQVEGGATLVLNALVEGATTVKSNTGSGITSSLTESNANTSLNFNATNSSQIIFVGGTLGDDVNISALQNSSIGFYGGTNIEDTTLKLGVNSWLLPSEQRPDTISCADDRATKLDTQQTVSGQIKNGTIPEGLSCFYFENPTLP